MTSDHVRAVQERRRSGASGPHNTVRDRGAETREAIQDATGDEMTGYHVQQHQNPGDLTWQDHLYVNPMGADPAKHLASLASRRKDRKLTRFPSGLEFDVYHPAAAPAPELAGLRVRIWCVDAHDPAEALGKVRSEMALMEASR